MHARVKICGNTSYDDAIACAEAGADMVGFIFHRGSKRFLDFDEAAGWLGRLPSGVVRVGVFVDAPADEIRRIVGSGLIDIAQLHGNESPEFAGELGVPFFKAVRVTGLDSLRGIDGFGGDILMLDSPQAGSGVTFDWRLAAEVVKKNPRRHIILAGGLTPGNVGSALESVRPWGVDVASGVESAPGVKDLVKVRNFIAEAKRAAIVPGS
jgi:phosphoribosylanthranilate isomerase